MGTHVILFDISEQNVYAQNVSTSAQFQVGNKSRTNIMEQNLTDVITDINFKELNNVTDP